MLATRLIDVNLPTAIALAPSGLWPIISHSIETNQPTIEGDDRNVTTA